MTVKLEGTIKRFIGLSSDRKPTIGANPRDDAGEVLTLTATDLPAGSSFLETDTGTIWRWNGSTWSAAPIDNASGEWLGLIYGELVKLRELKELTS
ncbi:MAG: hypothetical protein Q7R41_11845 [Phycisphaerales bacterium]|nr:hypothetical protein [Phycisphaerales bacterium]